MFESEGRGRSNKEEGEHPLSCLIGELAVGRGKLCNNLTDGKKLNLGRKIRFMAYLFVSLEDIAFETTAFTVACNVAEDF